MARRPGLFSRLTSDMHQEYIIAAQSSAFVQKQRLHSFLSFSPFLLRVLETERRGAYMLGFVLYH